MLNIKIVAGTIITFIISCALTFIFGVELNAGALISLAIGSILLHAWIDGGEK